MSIQQTIETKITQALSPEHLEVVNESFMHNVPPDSESHFKVVVVSPEFEGKRLVQRHRMINQLLADELKNDIHALAIHTFTSQEWAEKQQQAKDSPECLGGSKS